MMQTMLRSLRVSVTAAGLAALMSGCGGCGPEEQLGVAEGVYGELGGPMSRASGERLEAFERGEAVALRQFSVEEGLGPEFNASSSCGGCHERPMTGGGAPRYRNFQITGARLSDGSVVLLGRDGVQRHFKTTAPHRVPNDPDADFFVTRNPIPFFGVGALAEIPESEILKHADPRDEDGDGISGRPNYDRGFVGRFGRKAQTVSLEGFVRGPLFNHLGVTSDPLPEERKAELPVPSDGDGNPRALLGLSMGAWEPPGACINCQAAAPEEPLFDEDGAADPELSEDDLFDLVSYVMLLAAPRPEPLDEVTAAGEQMFKAIGCASCHVPGLEGPRGTVKAYTDLLLHDMGPELADGLEQGVATGSEFRTPPLWGIAAVQPYLHDGRADTLDEAIRWHGGEGEASREAYEALSASERGQLIAFLESLGGRELASEGLLAPGDPAPEAGEYGGPVEALTGAELVRFERGRRLFDADVTKRDGLGPRFSGDSCRACHFEPTIGGAGPIDVNVMRQGIREGDTFFEAEGGVHVHRFHRDEGVRPGVDPNANIIVMRQTPALYGVGLIDRIPEASIVARADPQDVDGDEISGRVARDAQGRVGRFGWKGNIATLEGFVRDALGVELGKTLEDDDAFDDDFSADEDGVADPEQRADEFEDLMFYTTLLGPPPASHIEGVEAAGSALFSSVGCARCHVPELEAGGGEKVRLYSDLLLHDIGSAAVQDIERGDAMVGEFRTPPLWGVGKTAPYMHDGLSATLDEAIRRHRGEAESVRVAYEALSDEERATLINYLEGI